MLKVSVSLVENTYGFLYWNEKYIGVWVFGTDDPSVTLLTKAKASSGQLFGDLTRDEIVEKCIEYHGESKGDI